MWINSDRKIMLITFYDLVTNEAYDMKLEKETYVTWRHIIQELFTELITT